MVNTTLPQGKATLAILQFHHDHFKIAFNINSPTQTTYFTGQKWEYTVLVVHLIALRTIKQPLARLKSRELIHKTTDIDVLVSLSGK